MRAYNNRAEHQRPYPWERQKKEELSRNLDNNRRNADYKRDEPFLNGLTKAPVCKKYISVVSEGNYFIASKAPLPDRIELRMCGTGALTQARRSLSIPDLYRVKMKPVPEPVVEDIVDVAFQEEVHAQSSCFDDHSNLSKSGSLSSLKEMYISQYTHHFDSNEPRSHIAGWKVDIEPNGIPHRRSRMCVLNNPMISDSRKRPERPKSAPPSLAHEFEIFTSDIENDQLSSATLPRFGGTEFHSLRSNDDLSSRLRELIVDAEPPVFNDDSSSFGYEPSDDNSEASSFLQENSRNFILSRPKLIRLSADFPGVRNLEKMRRKRQSMGSASTGSSSMTPSPSNGEYGFFVALTSNEQEKQRRRNSRRAYYSTS